jgi:hypothetical protein
MIQVWIVLGIEEPEVQGGVLFQVARYTGRAIVLGRNTLGWALEYDTIAEYTDEKTFKQWGCQKAARVTARVLKGLQIKMPEQRADWRERP